MAAPDDLKIWKYMDVAKFVSLLATESLYFACPTQFNDPYECALPRSHAEAFSAMTQRLADDMLSLRPQFAAQSSDSLRIFDDTLKKLQRETSAAQRKAASRFGVSCWHMNEYESDAMWKIYSALGQGVAIESSVGNLRASLADRESLQIDAVRYMDFDNDPIEKGHGHYSLFIKRKCFEHEKELRATVLLPQEGVGALVACDLGLLVIRVHVSPLVDCYVRDAVEALCLGRARVLDKPVVQSDILTAPDYGIHIDIKPKSPVPA